MIFLFIRFSYYSKHIQICLIEYKNNIITIIISMKVSWSSKWTYKSWIFEKSFEVSSLKFIFFLDIIKREEGCGLCHFRKSRDFVYNPLWQVKNDDS